MGIRFSAFPTQRCGLIHAQQISNKFSKRFGVFLVIGKIHKIQTIHRIHKIQEIHKIHENHKIHKIHKIQTIHKIHKIQEIHKIH